MKKIISYLIAVMMVFTMMPYTAFATSGNQQAPEKPIGITLEPWINPEYQNVISEEDLNRDGEPISLYSSGITYAETPEEGADVMREYMVNRVESFMLYYKFPRAKAEAVGDGTWFNETWDGIIEGTFEHTGVPVEGDYLHKHYGGLASGSITITFDENYENYLMAIPIYVTVYTDYDQEEELTAAVDSLLAEIIDDGMTDYEKIRAIYDYMTANIVYDYEHLNNNSYKLQYTAYAALLNKTSVCQGYANLFYRLALECGIDTRIITGQANGGGHAWNIVKLGSKYYLVDATWDASYAQVGYDYEYFLKPEFEDHTTDDEYLSGEFKTAYPMSETEYAICTEHTAEVIPAVDATCTTTGWTEGSKCANCGEMIKAQDPTSMLEHCFNDYYEVHAPTCEEEGLLRRDCAYGCGVFETAPLPASGHTSGAAATCTTAQNCTACGEELAPALQHDIVTFLAKKPTCSAFGWEAYEACNRCDYTTYKELEMLEHDYGSDWEGNSYSHWHACQCGAITDRSDHSYTWVIDNEPTENTTGLKHEECTVCHAVRNENTIMNRLEHKHNIEKFETVQATCTESGIPGHWYCTICNAAFTDKEGKYSIAEVGTTSPLGHSYGGYFTGKEPTCKETGYMYRECIRCGEHDEELVILTTIGHVYSDWMYDEKAHWKVCAGGEKAFEETHNFTWVVDREYSKELLGIKHEECTVCGVVRNENTVIDGCSHACSMTLTYNQEATCTADGNVTYYTCDNCKGIFSDAERMCPISLEDTVVPATGHNYGEWKVNVESTCGYQGYRERKCKNCDKSESELLPLVTDKHNWTEWSYDAPTCYDSGQKWRYCLDCHEREDIFYPKTNDHKWTEWHWEGLKYACADDEGYRKCTACGKEETKVIPATAKHKFKETILIEPTATEPGWKSRECQVCYMTLESRIPAGTIAHIWEVSVVYTKATFKQNGYVKLYCINKCGAPYRYVTVNKLKSVNLNKNTFVYDGKAKLPTVTVKDVKGKKLTEGKDYTVKYKNAKGKVIKSPTVVGEYKAVVTFKKKYKGTVEKSFTVKPKSTQIADMIPGKKQIKVTWQKRTAQVTGYEIQYSTTKNFTKKTTKTLKVKNFKTTSKTIKNLKAKKKYWVKIRTYKNVNGKLYYSTWSKVKIITTK